MIYIYIYIDFPLLIIEEAPQPCEVIRSVEGDEGQSSASPFIAGNTDDPIIAVANIDGE